MRSIRHVLRFSTAVCAVALSGCGSSKSSSSSVAEATSTTTTLSQNASQSTDPSVPPCSKVPADTIGQRLALTVKEPTSTAGSQGQQICTYKTSPGEGSDVKITYTPKASTSTVAQAKQAASGHNAKDLSGVGDAGYQASWDDADGIPTNAVGAVKNGLMIEISGPAGLPPEQALLTDLLG